MFENSTEEQSPSCVVSNADQQNNLRWFMIVRDQVSLYGQLLDTAVVDGRARLINYTLNDDNTITACIPHFWSFADMDPNYSVLIGDKNANCDAKIDKGKDVKRTIAIVVPVVVVSLIIIVVLSVLFGPKIKMWLKRKRMHRLPSHVDVDMDEWN
eukprot:Phypoly_transcript_20895.p1 GENE.Phypoly_transcript_20895~~Phypoly_transcript_20895.p1  ORF type:complete len:155 (+),score=15.04 Phypoly_transcript_20895:135-599(+)